MDQWDRIYGIKQVIGSTCMHLIPLVDDNFLIWYEKSSIWCHNQSFTIITNKVLYLSNVVINLIKDNFIPNTCH